MGPNLVKMKCCWELDWTLIQNLVLFCLPKETLKFLSLHLEIGSMPKLDVIISVQSSHSMNWKKYNLLNWE